MSLLAPLYFLGALAIGLPILFHLVRRRPKERMPFSSLMFLQPAPPRLTRRSRLDDWLLLLMRALAVLLIAAAFSRPFLRSESATQWQPPGRDLLLLVDTSASMRQTGVWEEVQQRVGEELADLGPQDRIGLVAFDRRPQTLVDVAIAPDELSHADAVAGAVRSLQPTWHRSNLGLALASAADQLNSSEGGDERASRKEIVLISDLQSGSNLDMLQNFPWPPEIRLRVEPATSEQTTNAAVSVLQDTATADPQAEATSQVEATSPSQPTSPAQPTSPSRRVRVSSEPGSSEAQFTLQWIDGKGLAVGGESVSANVPPGEMRVFQLPTQPTSAVAVRLSGDQQDFDNVAYVSSPQPVTKQLLYLGADPPEPRESLPFYLQRASFDTARQTISFRRLEAGAAELDTLDSQDIALVVAGDPHTQVAAAPLQRVVRSGGRVLCVLSAAVSDPAAIESFINAVTGAAEGSENYLRIGEADVDDYSLLVDLDFRDPLFSIFADPRYSDFSKIRFWSHRSVTLPASTDWQTLARFDDQSPALLRLRSGDGQVLVLAAGWQPSASQLALSTKFVPLLARMMDPDAGTNDRQPQFTVGDPLPPEWQSYESVVGPDGQTRLLAGEDAAGDDWFAAPGLYRFDGADAAQTVAFNLAASESETQPMDTDILETMGVRLSDREPSDQELAETERQMRDVELEDSQQWWRWLVLSALGLLLAESWWAGKRTQQVAGGTG